MSAQTPDTPYAIVFVDGHIHGPLETLRDIPASQVGEFRFYNMIEAGATFGIQGRGAGGGIAVKTREKIGGSDYFPNRNLNRRQSECSPRSFRRKPAPPRVD